MDIGARGQGAHVFGRFRLDPNRRVLTHGGDPVALRPTAFDLLLRLVESPGQVVGKDELLDAVWAGRVVEEASISQAVFWLRAALRRAGGAEAERLIVTAPGRGYRFTGDVVWETPSTLAAEPAEATADEAQRRPEAGKPRWPPWRISAVAAGLALAGAAMVGAWFLWTGPGRRPAGPPTIAVSVLTGAPEDRAMADRLTGELKSTLSHMRGLRLIEAPSASAPPKTDLVLDGSVERDGGQPSVKLALHDGRSGARVWGATFDGRAMADPTVEERAVAAPTQYLAIWLGERLSGRPAARDPESPELATLVIQGRRALREADDARLRRQWPRFLQLTRAAEDATDRALAMDPHAPRALMLRFELDSWPLYPRPGESPQAFKTRREAGARALDQALAADPDDPEVLIAAGQEDTRGLRWDDAGKLLQRAVAIDPNSADANVWYAYHLGRIGQCAAGLRYARIAAGLQPDQVWTQMAPPRLLLCAGRQDEALADYRALQVKEPGNVFLVRDIYLWLMARRHSDGIRKMVAFERDGLWGGRPPGPIAAVLSRAGAGADALDGKPQALIAQLDAEYAAITHHEAGPLAFGRSEGDALFPLALEYAEAGDTDKALNTLREAVEAGSLYLPWALPYGSNPFPASVRDDARFKALWKSSKALSELMDQRRRALATR